MALPSFGLVCSPLIEGEYVAVQAGEAFRQIHIAARKVGWLTMEEEGGMMGALFLRR
ncbi:MAG: hypothetical protein R3C53_18480 [Pirellulaceae bacterium]